MTPVDPASGGVQPDNSSNKVPVTTATPGVQPLDHLFEPMKSDVGICRVCGVGEETYKYGKHPDPPPAEVERFNKRGNLDDFIEYWCNLDDGDTDRQAVRNDLIALIDYRIEADRRRAIQALNDSKQIPKIRVDTDDATYLYAWKDYRQAAIRSIDPETQTQ